MPTFQYEVRDRSGKTTTGFLDATTMREVAAKLRDDGFYVTSIQPVAAIKSKTKTGAKKVTLRELLLFTRQFSVMLKAGLNLVSCLNLLAAQTENPYFKTVLQEIRRSVEGGETLYNSLAKYPKVFPPIFIHMVEAGEAGGILETVFQRLNEHFDREFALRKKVQGAMVYPAIISVVAVFVVIGLMVFVLPVFSGMFEDAGMKLPAITRALISVSNFMRDFWYILVGLVGAGIYSFKKYRDTEKGRYKIDKFLFGLKIVGPAIQKIVLARFSRTLATLLNSGVLIINSMEIVERAVANGVVAEAAANARMELTKGSGLSKPLSDTGTFPLLFTQMIAVGEETGELPSMLTQVAEYYEKEAEYAIETLTSLIEPAIIIVLGAVVGFIVIAIAIPMLDINSGKTIM